MYIFKSANLTFEVQKSNLTLAFMHLDNFAWKSFQASRIASRDVILRMSNWKLRFENAKIFLLFCFGFSVWNLHLWNAIWHYVIALLHQQVIWLKLEQVTNSPLELQNQLPQTTIWVSATGCFFTNVQYIFGVQSLLLQILKLNYQIQISNSFWFFVNMTKCEYLHYQMSICNRKFDNCMFMTGTYSSNFVFIFAIHISHLKLQKSNHQKW